MGVDSDNGGEFINHQLKDWCDQNHIQFTRSRPYRKNDNCFVEQKNGDVVRKTVGHHRFEGQDMYDALEAVYRCLNPLLNWYPTLRLIAKEKQASGRYKKIYEKVPKTPCRRLLESPEVAEEHKAELRRRLALFNPVALKREMDTARERLLKLAAQKGYYGRNRLSGSARYFNCGAHFFHLDFILAQHGRPCLILKSLARIKLLSKRR
ncbi:MAG: transposase family protein [Treponema sp.]|nr:transposase family protein [Treponema sp.]